MGRAAVAVCAGLAVVAFSLARPSDGAGLGRVRRQGAADGGGTVPNGSFAATTTKATTTANTTAAGAGAGTGTNADGSSGAATTVGPATTTAAGAASSLCGRDIVIPQGTAVIASAAYVNCTLARTVSIPRSVTRIGAYAFAGCASLVGVNLPNTVTFVGLDAFAGAVSLTEVNVSSALTAVADRTFWGCGSLRRVRGLAQTAVTRIGTSAFEGCASLRTLALPPTVVNISAEAFKACSSLIEVTLTTPSSLQRVGDRAFVGCGSLQKFDAASTSLRAIGDDAFQGCGSLSEAKFPSTLAKVGIRAFAGTHLYQVDVPAGVALSTRSFASIGTLMTIRGGPFASNATLAFGGCGCPSLCPEVTANATASLCACTSCASVVASASRSNGGGSGSAAAPCYNGTGSGSGSTGASYSCGSVNTSTAGGGSNGSAAGNGNGNGVGGGVGGYNSIRGPVNDGVVVSDVANELGTLVASMQGGGASGDINVTELDTWQYTARLAILRRRNAGTRIGRNETQQTAQVLVSFRGRARSLRQQIQAGAAGLNSTEAETSMWGVCATVADFAGTLMANGCDQTYLSEPIVRTIDRSFLDVAADLAQIGSAGVQSYDTAWSKVKVKVLPRGSPANFTGGFASSFYIPTETLASGGDYVGATFSEYLDTRLFKFTLNASEAQVGSTIIAVQITTTVSGSVEGVFDYTYNLNETELLVPTARRKPSCVYFVEPSTGSEMGNWSTDGCTTEVLNSTHARCVCTHLTSFAVMVSSGDGTSSDDAQALSIITYAGVTASLAGIVLTVWTVATVDKLGGQLRYQILLNLSVAFGLAIFFFCLLTTPTTTDGCRAVSFLTLYAFVAALLWNVVEAFDLYRTFVVVFNDGQARAAVYLRRFQLFAWGGAVVPPSIALAVSPSDFITTTAAGEPSLCWIDTRTDLRWAFLAPVCAVCAVNLSAAVLIIREIRGNTAHPKYRAVMYTLKVVTSISAVTGLAWLFAVLLVATEDLVFSYLFAIFASSQGFSIFYFHVVKNDISRSAWMHSLRSLTGGSRSSSRHHGNTTGTPGKGGRTQFVSPGRRRGDASTSAASASASSAEGSSVSAPATGSSRQQHISVPWLKRSTGTVSEADSSGDCHLDAGFDSEPDTCVDDNVASGLFFFPGASEDDDADSDGYPRSKPQPPGASTLRRRPSVGPPRRRSSLFNKALSKGDDDDDGADEDLLSDAQRGSNGTVSEESPPAAGAAAAAAPVGQANGDGHRVIESDV